VPSGNILFSATDACNDPDYGRTVSENYCSGPSLANETMTCSGVKCCADGACRGPAGELKIELRFPACPWSVNGRDEYLASIPSDGSAMSISGVAKLNNPFSPLPLKCTIKVNLVRVTGPDIKQETIAECVGATSCSFNFLTKPEEYDHIYPQYSAIADATDCCATTTMAVATLHLPKLQVPSFAVMMEGPLDILKPEELEARKLEVIYFPTELTLSDMSLDVAPKNTPTANAVGTTAVKTRRDSLGEPTTFTVEEIWWYGWMKNPPKDNLCLHPSNPYIAKYNATFTECGVKASGKHDISANLDLTGPHWSGWMFGDVERPENYDTKASHSYFYRQVKVCRRRRCHWVWQQQKRSVCQAKYHLKNPKLFDVGWKLEVKFRGQYAQLTLAEERFHKKQHCAEVPWSQGGINVNRTGRFQSLEGLNKSAQMDGDLSTDWSTLDNQACGLAKALLVPVVTTKLHEEIAQPLYDKMTQPCSLVQCGAERCWEEKTAKAAIGWTPAKAAMHFECAYPNCGLNPSQPPEP
jgi:hypothetical protein